MTSPHIRSCQEIGETVVAYIEGDEELSSWLHTRCTSWKVETTAYRRRLSALYFVACHELTASRPEVASSPHGIPLASLKRTLEERSLIELFAGLTNDPRYGDLRDVQEIWLISTGITNSHHLYWGWLHHGAIEFLYKILKREGQDLTTADLVQP